MKATILPSAERSFARLFGLGAEEAHTLIPEFIAGMHRTPKERRDGLETWRVGRSWDKVRILVERVSAEDVRVVDVLQPHPGWRVPARPTPPPIADRDLKPANVVQPAPIRDGRFAFPTRVTADPDALALFAAMFGLAAAETPLLLRELVASARPTSRAADDPRLAIWRASREWEWVQMVVRVSEDEVRILQIDRAPSDWEQIDQDRAARVDLPASAPPPPAPWTPIRDGRSRRRPGVVRSADPPPTSLAPPPSAPAIDPTLHLAAHLEISRGTYPSASSLADRLRVPRETARKALAVLELPEHNPREEYAAGLQVLRARRRPR